MKIKMSTEWTISQCKNQFCCCSLVDKQCNEDSLSKLPQTYSIFGMNVGGLVCRYNLCIKLMSANDISLPIHICLHLETNEYQ